MASKETGGNTGRRVLVLCVDRDGDLEVKGQVRTPVLGRTENLNAAVTLALVDPEEPDANAMFESVRIYDRLKAENKSEEVYEIATLSGSEHGGVGADRKIVSELTQLLTSFPAAEVILVTDGYTDEAVLPLIQSRVPVSSIRRIVVKHSESIEETAALFSRYLKTIAQNPRYSRWALGLPGLLLLILGILSIFGWVQYFLIAFVIVMSGVLLVRGFGIDRAAKSFYKWMKEYSPPPLQAQISTFATIAGALLIVLGVYYGGTDTFASVSAASDLAGWLGRIPEIAGFFISASVTLIVAGVCVALLGRAIRWYLERDARLLRNAAMIVTIIWSRQIFDATSGLLIEPELGYEKVIFSIAVGILIGVASILVILVIHRSAKGFFKEPEEKLEEFDKD